MFQPPFMRPNMPQSWFGGRVKPPVGSALPPSFIGNRQPGLPPMGANAFQPLANRPENMAASAAHMAAKPPQAAAGGPGMPGMGSSGTFTGGPPGPLPGSPDGGVGGINGPIGGGQAPGGSSGGNYAVKSPFTKG